MYSPYLVIGNAIAGDGGRETNKQSSKATPNKIELLVMITNQENEQTAAQEAAALCTLRKQGNIRNTLMAKERYLLGPIRVGSGRR